MDRCTYNCSILSITFSEAFDGTETNWRTEAAAQQICGKAELLSGKNPWLFKYENETMAGISNLQDKPSLLIKEGTAAAALFSHAVRDALIEQCFFWELKGNHSVHERTFA